jgi:hypothetical protein
MDKNVIFLFPLNKVLLELKKEIEQDQSINLFEVDMIEEYQQVVATLDSAITFSTDLKKTENYLNRCKKIVLSKLHKNILIAKDNPSGLVLSKMEKNGLDEVLNEFTPLKTLSHKIKVFFKTIETTQSQVEYELTSSDNSIDTHSRQRIERLAKDVDRPVTEDLLDKKIRLNSFGNFKFSQNLKAIPFNKNFQNLRKNIKDLRFERLMTLDNLKQDESTDENLIDTSILQQQTSSEIDYLSLPEIQFYPAIKIFDPIVLYMETLLDGMNVEFKRKFLNMVLHKRYGAEIHFVDENNLSEETRSSTVPYWVNEARNSDQNQFVLPVVSPQGIKGQVLLEVTGAVDFDKMNELEFWCYLGKSLWT